MNVILFGVVMIGSVLSLKHFATRASKSSMVKKAMSTGVQRMNVEKFAEILKSEKRSAYQIIDVRETLELHHARIPGDDIIHLPLSNANAWSQQVLTGALLDAEKPTLCLCHHGVRSMQVASFLCKHPNPLHVAIYNPTYLNTVYTTGAQLIKRNSKTFRTSKEVSTRTPSRLTRLWASTEYRI